MLATIEAQQREAVELAARHEQALKEAHDSHHEEKERLEEVVSQIQQQKSQLQHQFEMSNQDLLERLEHA